MDDSMVQWRESKIAGRGNSKFRSKDLEKVRGPGVQSTDGGLVFFLE